MTRFGFVVSLLLLSSTGAYADFQAGMTAYNNRDFGKAITIWEADGAKGDLNAQYNLGALYEQGAGEVTKDLSAAYAWYRLAAAQNVDAALVAIDRLKPILTAGQIDDGDALAIKILGKWYRQNIGQNEQEYQKNIAVREAKQKARIEAEKRALSQRAQRQRALISQRDNDAKMAKKLETASRAAAIQVAREQAEEAKRNAYLAGKQREEDARLAALKAENEKQGKRQTAKERLAELKSKQQGGSSTAVIVASSPAAAPNPVVATVPVAPKQQGGSSTAVIVASSPAAASNPAVATAPKQAVSKTMSPTVSAAQPKTATLNTPTKATVSQPAAKQAVSALKTKLPVLSNGMDAEVVSGILKQADLVSVETAAAKAEILSARTEIEALKWSLISAARGKSGAKKMNVILVKTMTDAQITEANRRAAAWILKRQKRK